MAKKKKNQFGKGLGIVLFLLAIIAALYFNKDTILGALTETTAPVSTPVSGGEVQFHFIDVGQGDAALIRTEWGDVLIDAGTNSSEDELKAYMVANNADTLHGPSFKITWKEVTSSRLDGKALKAAAPTIWEQFAKQTTTRRFILA